jgi:hypothetical protein
VNTRLATRHGYSRSSAWPLPSTGHAPVIDPSSAPLSLLSLTALPVRSESDFDDSPDTFSSQLMQEIQNE